VARPDGHHRRLGPAPLPAAPSGAAARLWAAGYFGHGCRRAAAAADKRAGYSTTVARIRLSRTVDGETQPPAAHYHVATGVTTETHCGRKDLERLFELQPRAAQKSLELLPSVTLGTSRFVERGLENFLLAGARPRTPPPFFASTKQNVPPRAAP
jgi:hypothetical protein